jgi:4-hydroxy-2-oxoheptanedioate aldolase
MAKLQLADRLGAGETLYCGWSGLADALAAEAVARAGFDAVCLDTQHGFQDFRALRESITAVAGAGVAPIVRVPYGAVAEVGRAVDMGAEAIICPMINTRADAESLVRVMKFPPVGARSWAPQRISMLWGLTPDEVLAGANRLTLALAMIETAEAVGNLDDILSVPGIDGVFVGPNDLSISLLDGARVDPFADEVSPALENIAAKAREHGKHAAVYVHSPQRAPVCRALGYNLIAGGSDVAFIRAGAEALAGAMRQK